MYKQAIVNNLIKIAKLNTLNATGAAVGAGIGGTAGYLGSNALSKYIGLKGGGKENDFLHKRLGIDPNSKYRKYGDITLRTLGTLGGAALGGYGGYLGGDALHNKYYADKPTKSNFDYSTIDNNVDGVAYYTSTHGHDYPEMGYVGGDIKKDNTFNNYADKSGIYTTTNHPTITVQRIGPNGEKYNIRIAALDTGRKDHVGRINRGSFILGGNVADLTDEKKKQLASIINGLDREYKAKGTTSGWTYGNQAYVNDTLKLIPEGDEFIYRYRNGVKDTDPTVTDEERKQLATDAFDILTKHYGNSDISDDPNSVDNRVLALLNGDKPGFLGLGTAMQATGGEQKVKDAFGDNIYFDTY